MPTDSTCEPRSPMNTCAGLALYHRKPASAPDDGKRERRQLFLPLRQGDGAVGRIGEGADARHQAVHAVRDHGAARRHDEDDDDDRQIERPEAVGAEVGHERVVEVELEVEAPRP